MKPEAQPEALVAADLQIDEFCRNVARALLRVHSAFPQPIVLFVEDLIGTTEVDEFGLHPPEHRACFSALLWLGSEQYLRFGETIKQEALDQVVLTERTLLKLHRSGAANRPHLEAMRGALKARSSSQLRAAVFAFLEA